MRRRILFPTIAVSALALLFSCQGNDADVDDVLPTIVPSKAQVSAGAGSVFVSVTSSSSWTIEATCSDGGYWATVEPVSGTGSKGDVRLRYSANEGDSSRSVKLTLTTSTGKTASATVTQESEGGSVTPEPAVGGHYGADVTDVGWLEVPATVANDGRDFFTHDMSGGKYVSAAVSGTRNYSFYWDYEGHVSQWVAYPLNRQLRGSGSYDYNWLLDPLLPSNMQPNLSNGSYGGLGFDGVNYWNRGHQMPRADRQTSKVTVASTCYPTNITPQDGSFNSGIWARLEGRVRGYADSADTLYVVTGCVQEGSSTYTGNRTGFTVKVPVAYFKALLFRGTSTYATGGYMAAGYYLPHDSKIAEGNFTDYLMSIDDLEKKTGIDFFPNLVSQIGQEKADAIEAAAPSNFWK